MPIKKFSKFRLIFHIICLKCSHEDKFSILGGNSFNIERDLILSEIEQINLSYKTYTGCENWMFFDFKKLFNSEQVRKFIMGSFLSKKNQVKIKNLLPKGKEFSHLNTCGEITLNLTLMDTSQHEYVFGNKIMWLLPRQLLFLTLVLRITDMTVNKMIFLAKRNDSNNCLQLHKI